MFDIKKFFSTLVSRLLALFVLLTISNFTIAFLIGDVKVFILREIVTSIFVFLLYHFREQLEAASKDSLKTQEVLISVNPVFKYDHIFMALTFPALMVCFYLEKFPIPAFFGALVFAYFSFFLFYCFFRWYHLTLLVRKKIVSFSYKPSKVLSGTRRSIHSNAAACAAAYTVGRMGPELGKVLGLFGNFAGLVGSGCALAKVAYGWDYRPVPFNAFSYMMTGLTSSSESAYTAGITAVQVLEDIDPNIKSRITYPNTSQISMERTETYLAHKLRNDERAAKEIKKSLILMGMVARAEVSSPV